MQYTADINLSVFSLLILLLIYFNVRQPLQKILPQNHVLILIIFSCILVILLDVLSVLSNGQLSAYSFFINTWFNVALFVIVPIPAMLWIIYVFLQVFQNMEYVKRLKIPFIILFTLNALLSITSTFTGMFFFIDLANEFHRGPLYWANLGLCYSCLLYSAAVVAANRKNIEKRLHHGLIIFIIPVTIGGLLQFVYHGGSLTWAGLALSLLTVYFNILNKNLNTDYLTGLYNRRQLDYYIQQKIKNSSESKSFSAILIDLDRFKYINDTFGHSVGDQALQTAALLIRKSVKKEDFIARYGGDEFCIVLDTDEASVMEEIVERLRLNLKNFNMGTKEAYQIALSIGYGIYDYSLKQSCEEFIAYIDSLMYKNKEVN